MDGRDFGVFYESVLSRSPKATLVLVQEDEMAEASIALDPDLPEAEVEAELLDSGEGVHLWRRLSSADVFVGGIVHLEHRAV